MEPSHQQKIAENELLELARKKTKKWKDFYIHCFIYVIGIVIWLLKTYTNAPLHFFPIQYINWFVMAIWTVAFAIQAVTLLISETLLGKRWEDKQLKNIMEEKSEKQTWE